MKRDWDTIREILREVREAPPGKCFTYNASLPELGASEVGEETPAQAEANRKAYNAFLLVKMGFVEAHVLEYSLNPSFAEQVMIRGLTPEGHDFYETAMEKKPRWEKTKAVLAAAGVTGGTEAIKITTKLVMEQIKDSLGS